MSPSSNYQGYSLNDLNSGFQPHQPGLFIPLLSLYLVERHSAVEIKWLFRDKQLIAHKFLPSLTSVFLCAPAGQKAWGAQICLLHHNKFSQRPSEARLKFRRGSCLKVKCLNHNVPKRESVFLPIECWASLEWFRVDSEERMIVSIAINRSWCMFVCLFGWWGVLVIRWELNFIVWVLIQPSWPNCEHCLLPVKHEIYAAVYGWENTFAATK